MRTRLLFAVVALLALPACLDPIVGTQCARGYSPCGGKCVPTGSCATQDAGQVADGGDATLLDASSGEPESDVDAEAIESGPATDAQSASDGAENEVGVEKDGPSPTEAGSADDGGGQEDLLAPDIDAESGNAILDGPEGASSDAETANSGDDGGTPAVEIDGASGADDTDGAGGDDAVTVDDAMAEGDSLLPCGDCVDAVDAGSSASDDAGVILLGEDAGKIGDSVGNEPGVLLAGDGGADDAVPDASGTEVEGTWQDAGPLQCAGRLSPCGDQCVDLVTDPNNCNACGVQCASGVCLPTGCLVCDPEQAPTVCGTQCVNTGFDPDNCGGCFRYCGTGLCSGGKCQASGTGRVIVIGHDYLVSRTTMNEVLGNAVFLWPVNPVHLLAYKGQANSAAIDGADRAIAQVAAGRPYVTTYLLDNDDLAQRLASDKADVFLIYGQEDAADDAALRALGQKWASALSDFVNKAGGTVIVLDGYYAPANSGTVQIINQTELFKIQQNASVSHATCTVVARGDALASGLTSEYRCEVNSVNFTTTELPADVTTVVESGTVVDSGVPSALPVVIHKLFP